MNNVESKLPQEIVLSIMVFPANKKHREGGAFCCDPVRQRPHDDKQASICEGHQPLYIPACPK